MKEDLNNNAGNFTFFQDTMRSLFEAIAIEKGQKALDELRNSLSEEKIEFIKFIESCPTGRLHESCGASINKGENNMNRIAEFKKVSYEQFKKDYLNIFGGQNEEDIKKAYDIIKLPIRKTSGSAGHDFVTPVDIEIEPSKTFTAPTGIRCEMQKDYVLNIYVRSSIGFKYQTVLSNGTGIIDSDYAYADNEGHIMMKLINHSDKTVHIDAGDAIAQGVFLQYGITKNDDVDTVRTGGIGSTGKQ